MTLGIVGRCDTGGLAALTREVHRHLHPARTLLLDLEEQGRGDCIADDYIHGDVYKIPWKGALPDRAIDWLCAPGIDTVWTAEFWYDDRLLPTAHHAGIRTVCYAMPELSPWAIAGWQGPFPREIHVPTWWRLDTLPNALLLPMPVARDRLPYRKRTEVTRLFHPVGVAMADRNGTQILLDAIPFIQNEVNLTIRSDRPIDAPSTQRVVVDVVSAQSADYWDGYPLDIDLLVLPRRYGGLSLPVQECASLGIPAVMLGSDPYAQLPFVTSIPATGSHEERMKGGRVPVHSADPRVLATAIDYLIEHPAAVADASAEADRWADEHDWDGPLGDRWRQALDA